MTEVDATVYVVDDDESIRRAMTRLFRSEGFFVQAFDSAIEFLATPHSDDRACLLLDLRMPGMSGTELQHELQQREADLPIVMLTGHADVPLAVLAMRQGAVDVLPKPVENELLVNIVRQAILARARTRRQWLEVRDFRRRVETLTRREYEVLLLVINGLLNKQIAARLEITETTVKVHRGRVMEKTGVASIAELVRLCERAGLRQEAALG